MCLALELLADRYFLYSKKVSTLTLGHLSVLRLTLAALLLCSDSQSAVCRAFCKRVRIWDVLRCPELHRGSALASRTPASSALSCFTFGRSKSSVGRAAVKTDEESPNLPCTDLRHKLEQALFSASRSCCRVSLQAAESRSHVLGGLAVLPAGPAKPRFRLNVCFLQMLATQKVFCSLLNLELSPQPCDLPYT